MSTVDTSSYLQSSNVVEEQAESGMKEEGREQKLGAADPVPPVTTTNSSNAPLERMFHIGQWLDVKDTVQQWLEATVMDMNQSIKKIFVHYNGW